MTNSTVGKILLFAFLSFLGWSLREASAGVNDGYQREAVIYGLMFGPWLVWGFVALVTRRRGSSDSGEEDFSPIITKQP